MKTMFLTREQLDAVHAINLGYRILVASISRELKIPISQMTEEMWTPQQMATVDHMFSQYTPEELGTWSTWVNAGHPRLELKQSVEEFFAEFGVTISGDTETEQLPERYSRPSSNTASAA